MMSPFEEALQELLDRYYKTDSEEIISALECALMAAREQAFADD